MFRSSSGLPFSELEKNFPGVLSRRTNQGKDIRRSGAEGRNRTADTRLFRPLLYRLSYLGTAVDYKGSDPQVSTKKSSAHPRGSGRDGESRREGANLQQPSLFFLSVLENIPVRDIVSRVFCIIGQMNASQSQVTIIWDPRHQTGIFLERRMSEIRKRPDGRPGPLPLLS